jgi:hypothetical protein
MNFSNLLFPAHAQAAIDGLTIGHGHQKVRPTDILGLGTIRLADRHFDAVRQRFRYRCWPTG